MRLVPVRLRGACSPMEPGGCGRLEWAVLDWNEPAITFYRNLGARPLEEWTVFRVAGPALHALADRF